MRSKGIVNVCLLALPCILLSGCLSLQLGGRTHNCSGSVEMMAANTRIAQLESRINALEHYAGITPPPSQSSFPMASHDFGGVQVRTVETMPSGFSTR